MTSVDVRVQRLSIPTYGVGDPLELPLFLDKRVYQGSSGVVYPLPVVERAADTPEPHEWTAVTLENAFLRVMILPELGGRVQMAYDKTQDYHFVYHNRVIKPALVGLCGPWISGGIEFNWPQHHRPTTYSPLDWWIEDHADGARTLWCTEVEPMFGTRGTHGFTLRPGAARLDIDVRLYNRTSQPQSFLWWANPAVAVNDEYQSVFPPDVHAVMDHGKRDVSAFPIARGTYYKVDYAPGTDISRYRNIPVPTSYMAHHSDYNFVGCYDHGRRAGMMHVADHHRVPGKKQWTWGCGEFGRAWDRELTDDDGPYIELMCGAFTDNQPDFTWIAPGEEKRFRQSFLPYQHVGPPSNASDRALVALHVDGTAARLAVYAVERLDVDVELWHDPAPRGRLHNHKNMELPRIDKPLGRGATLLHREALRLSPTQSWQSALTLARRLAPHELTMRLVQGGAPILAFTPPDNTDQPAIPSPARPARAPGDITSNEELYLEGLHLEQYRHATFRPEPYYREALRRDAGDARCNVALGRLRLRAGDFTAAEAHFRAAIDRLTLRNPNPADGEAYYQLGIALRLQGRIVDAADAFQKAAWSAAWRAAALFEAARCASRLGDRDQALVLIDEVLDLNALHQGARHLRVALKRLAGDVEGARAEVVALLSRDGASPALLREAALLGVEPPHRHHYRGDATTALLLALDDAAAGLWDDAVAVARSAADIHPMAAYYIGWFEMLRGDVEAARAALSQARRNPRTFFCPNEIEAVVALRGALDLVPDDGHAHYGLGNYLQSRREYAAAIDHWRASTRLLPDFAAAWRNLGLGLMNHERNGREAMACYERAVALAPHNDRLFFEFDQLRKRLNVEADARLAHLESRLDLVRRRDDLLTEYLLLLNGAARHDDVLAILRSHKFHPWEGGEGKPTLHFETALAELARAALEEGKPQRALELLDEADTLPANLSEGRLPAAHDNRRWFLRALALEAMGRGAESKAALVQASRGESSFNQAVYYNDQPPGQVFYKGLALARLGDHEGAAALFEAMIAHGDAHANDAVAPDYFAVSLPDFLVFDADMATAHRAHCALLRGLGLAGLGRDEEAVAALREVLALQADHLVARLHLARLQASATAGVRV